MSNPNQHCPTNAALLRDALYNVEKYRQRVLEDIVAGSGSVSVARLKIVDRVVRANLDLLDTLREDTRDIPF